jgi:hypothetical protein
VRLDLLPDEVIAASFQAIALPNPVGCQRIPSCRQLKESPVGLGRKLARIGPHGLAQVGEHAGIDFVGFSQKTASPGKIPDLPRVELRVEHIRRVKRNGEILMILPGGLEDHKGYGTLSFHRGKLQAELPEVLRIVSNSAVFSIQENVERLLGDIDSNVGIFSVIHISFSSLRLRTHGGRGSGNCSSLI